MLSYEVPCVPMMFTMAYADTQHCIEARHNIHNRHYQNQQDDHNRKALQHDHINLLDHGDHELIKTNGGHQNWHNDTHHYHHNHHDHHNLQSLVNNIVSI